MTGDLEIKRIIEGVLFVSHEPLSLTKLREIISQTHELTLQELKASLEALRQEYSEQRRAFQIEESAGGYLLRTVLELRPYLEKLLPHKRKEKLSRAALEILAILLHKEPITRKEIEEIRAVNSARPLALLLEKGLITVHSKEPSSQRATQYSLTKHFLIHFGLEKLDLHCLFNKSSAFGEAVLASSGADNRSSKNSQSEKAEKDPDQVGKHAKPIKSTGREGAKSKKQIGTCHQ